MSEPAGIMLKDGSLYMPRDVYDRFFAGLETIVLLRRDDDLLILPVRHASAGGYLLKRRNSAGDRVVTAPDFFRANDIAGGRECTIAFVWSDTMAALTAAGAFRLQT